MKAIVMAIETHAERVNTLKQITSMTGCCGHCLSLAAALVFIFKAAARAAGLSELELRRLRNELTPDDATADEIEFIDRFVGDLTAGPGQ